MKVLPGLGWGDGSGSVGALTLSHNKGGLYFRARTVPTNPNSTDQQAVRQAVQYLSSLWAAFTPSQKALWEHFALSNPVVDTLGSTITLSGQQSYIRVNMRLRIYGPGLSQNPPASMFVDTPSGTVTAVVDTAPTFLITLGIDDPEDLYVRATPPLSPGISNWKKYLRTLGVFDQATVDADVTTAYAARFGTPPATMAGMLVGFHVSGYGTDNGQISVPSPMQTIII